MILTDDELIETNKLIFNYVPERIDDKELRKIEKRVKLNTYQKIFAYEGIAKLFLNLIVAKDKGCWVKEDWTKYRRVRIGKNVIPAHRASYILLRGIIPPTLYVCHFCDRPGCVNPFHLFTGTHQENLLDYKQKYHPRARIIKREDGSYFFPDTFTFKKKP